MNIVKVISTEVDNLQRRIVKFLRYGKSDVQTSPAVAPYGIDSNPPKDTIAIYAETNEKGKNVIIGYINKNAIAKEGELRLFSTGALGAEKTYVYLTDAGDIELGGKVENLVKYSALNAGLQSEAGLINVELGKIAVVLNSLVPNSYTPTPVTINITAAKADKLKTS